MTDRFADVSPTERAAIVARELVLGRRLTAADVAELTECDRVTAWRVLGRLSRVLPIIEDEGCWWMESLNLEIE